MARLTNRKALQRALGDMGVRDYAGTEEITKVKELYDLMVANDRAENDKQQSNKPRKTRSDKGKSKVLPKGSNEVYTDAEPES